MDRTGGMRLLNLLRSSMENNTRSGGMRNVRRCDDRGCVN